MSVRSPIAMLVTLGLGAVVGAVAARQPHALPIGPQRGTLTGADPVREVEVLLGADLAAAAWDLKGTVGQVPRTLREALGFAPSQIVWSEGERLSPRTWQLRLRGLVVGEGRLRTDALLALQTAGGRLLEELAGERFQDPVTGRPGVWVDPQDEGQARLLGYDMLHPGFVMALHVDALLRRHLHELLTREETHRVLDRGRQLAPRTVDELLARVPVGTVQQVLRNLLREQVSLRDLPVVLEAMSDAASKGVDAEGLTEQVRLALGRRITADLCDERGVLRVIPLGGRWQALRDADASDPAVADLVRQLRARLDAARDAHTVLLAPHDVRASARRLMERALPDLPVLSEREVDPTVSVERLPDLGSA